MKAILNFLKHANAKSVVIISEHDLNVDLEAIHEIMEK